MTRAGKEDNESALTGLIPSYAGLRSSFEFDERRAATDERAFADRDAFYDAVACRFDPMFHLHRFENEQQIALGDDVALAARITELLAEPDRRAAVGAAAQARSPRYPPQAMADATLKLYARLSPAVALTQAAA